MNLRAAQARNFAIGQAPRRTPTPSARAAENRLALAITRWDDGQVGGGGGAWLVSKLIALLLLFGGSGVMYHVATSDEFRITNVRVSGNQLLQSSELEAAAAVIGTNIFWVREEEVRRRLQTLPAVQSARVTAFLPNRLEMRIGEYSAAAVWLAGGAAWCIDRGGRVLGPAPPGAVLPVIRSADPAPLQPGSQVDHEALGAAERLQQLTSAWGPPVREFDYSADSGLSIVADFGPRVQFGDSSDMEWKLVALAAIRNELQRTGQRAELIDVRFKDRPYVR